MRYVRAYHHPGEMNKTELAYSQYLELLKKAGEIESWAYEVETLKIGKDCRYTPDFRVLKVAYGFQFIEFHEVKGTIRKKNVDATKPYIEDDALVKIKAAAEMHPYKFIIVWRGKEGIWEKREIN